MVKLRSEIVEKLNIFSLKDFQIVKDLVTIEDYDDSDKMNQLLNILIQYNQLSFINDIIKLEIESKYYFYSNKCKIYFFIIIH